MAKEAMNAKVDGFLNDAPKWREEMVMLRRILLDGPLTEDLKWGKPCYAFEGHNIAIIQPFKDYCALLFMKGALLKDEQHILVQQTENVQAARQARFTSVQEIAHVESALKAYILEAAEAEKAGLDVALKKLEDYDIPEELQLKYDENPDLKIAFDALTPGRQRAYLLHFSEPKQAKTRQARVEKNVPRILSGKGLND